jgi:hypothetical protein
LRDQTSRTPCLNPLSDPHVDRGWATNFRRSTCCDQTLANMFGDPPHCGQRWGKLLGKPSFGDPFWTHIGRHVLDETCSATHFWGSHWWNPFATSLGRPYSLDTPRCRTRLTALVRPPLMATLGDPTWSPPCGIPLSENPHVRQLLGDWPWEMHLGGLTMCDTPSGIPVGGNEMGDPP